MFEYLMPLIVMPTYEHTLLDQTCKAAVARQIDYGKMRGVPWGISESGYNMIDGHLNYQYSAFGVPGLGLKRGLAGDLVIAPYASALALMVAPEEAARNLETLASNGILGRYGFYDAVDYTPTHLPRGRSNAVVRSFMAHHQGMSLLSLAYLLLDRPMQKRFESDPAFQATVLLLQERLPKATAFYSHAADSETHSAAHPVEEKSVRVYPTPHTPTPEVQLLSNGRYHVMITNAGGGYSRWKDMAVTRWREDTTCDNWGTFCYIRDVASGVYWSTAYQPVQQGIQRVRGDILGRAGGVPPSGRGPRHPYGDRGITRGRCRAAPDHHYQPFGDGTDNRHHELRRGRPCVARRGRTPSRLQQSLRSNRDHPAAEGDHRNPPTPFRR